MYRIDDLITEIHVGEAIEIPGKLTEEQQTVIETKILSRMKEAGNDSRKFPRRKKYIVVLAAAIIMALGLTVFAAQRNEWDITLINFMGLNKSDILQLEGGEVLINEKTTSTCIDYSEDSRGKEMQVSITGITSIGDKNSAYLRVNTDYELPQEFDETTDYILPEHSSIDITYKNIFGREEFRDYASSFTAFYEENKLGFLISIENCENLNRCNVSLKIENLYWYHDLRENEETDESEPEELLCEGLWQTDWTYSYKSNVRTRHTFKRIESEDGDCLLTKIEMSPISIRVEAIRNLKDREMEWTGNILEEIHYSSGKCIQIDKVSSGGIGNGIFIDEFVKVEELGEPLSPDEIDYLVICGEKVEL